MSTPIDNANHIMLNDSQLAVPLLDFLLWAVTPGVTESDEYEDVLDLLFMKSSAYRAGRDDYIASRRDVAA